MTVDVYSCYSILLMLLCFVVLCYLCCVALVCLSPYVVVLIVFVLSTLCPPACLGLADYLRAASSP